MFFSIVKIKSFLLFLNLLSTCFGVNCTMDVLLVTTMVGKKGSVILKICYLPHTYNSDYTLLRFDLFKFCLLTTHKVKPLLIIFSQPYPSLLLSSWKYGLSVEIISLRFYSMLGGTIYSSKTVCWTGTSILCYWPN